MGKAKAKARAEKERILEQRQRKRVLTERGKDERKDLSRLLYLDLFARMLSSGGY